jgi:hypothetical protein
MSMQYRVNMNVDMDADIDMDVDVDVDLDMVDMDIISFSEITKILNSAKFVEVLSNEKLKAL